MADSKTDEVATRTRAITSLAVATLILGGLRLILSVVAIWFLLNLMMGGLEAKPRPGAGRNFGAIDITPVLVGVFLPLLALAGSTLAQTIANGLLVHTIQIVGRVLVVEGAMKLSEVVQEVIRLGDASRAYWDRELPKHHPHYPVIRTGESLAPPPPEDAKIQALLGSLPEDQLYALTLLTYVGCGDFNADHLLPAYQTMKELFPSKDLAIAQITEMKTLADYLTDALVEIQKRHIDLDSLEFANLAAAN